MQCTADGQAVSDLDRGEECGSDKQENPEEPVISHGQLQLSEDLARCLFASTNHAMAGLVRELQRRTKKTQESDAAAADTAIQVLDCQEDQAENLLTSPEQGEAHKPHLWVVGGASTVADGYCQQQVRFVPKDARGKMDAASVKPPGPAVTVAMSSDGKKVPCLNPGRCARGFHSVWSTCKDMAGIVRLYPVHTLAAPLAVFVLLGGLGVWGVVAGSMSQMQQRKDGARSQAVDAATGFQIQLEQTYTPGVTFSLLVRQHPEWEYWLANFNSTAEELLSRVPAGALWNLQLQPFGQPMSVFPYRPSDAQLLFPPRDQLADPTRRESVLAAIATGAPQVAGPLKLGQGFLGALIRYPIFVPNVSAEETFGFHYRENTSAIPYSQLPASVRSCSMCYNNVTREKWWGMMTLVINYEAVALGDDAYLAHLRKQGFHYTLVRPINETYEQVIAMVGPKVLTGKDAVTVDVKAFNSLWQLRVTPAGGFRPSWTLPLVVAVLVMALFVSVLVLVAAASLKQARLLLDETMAANRNLADAMRRLEEEKERMDVLLLRQYDLLRCLDVNRPKKTGGVDAEGDDSVWGSKQRMMARIEDARRCLDAAKASSKDSIQLFEVLGSGAFGKVQRGLWRGTVVAVKTMILPANMTGQEKREKMAVMEAAISSSLVHPNIVTTYTYFIRPYHEPAHNGVQQMLTTLSTPQSLESTISAFGADPSCLAEESVSAAATDSTVHSYEVRLVLEFCDKGSLKDALEQNVFLQDGSFNLEAVVETASDVAKAMVHMHAANVLHADLKARNIMLKSSGTEGRGVIAKVADFGLSTRMEHQETHLSSCFQGTLTHMAPEVMLEGRISKAADVYAFGILMWELFCAADPFSGVPRAHLGHAITKECRRPKFPPFAPRDYVSLAARCWDPDAALRPSFEEVLAELGRMREALGGETRPLSIVPPLPITQSSNRSRSCSSNNTTSSKTCVGGGDGGTEGAGILPLHCRRSAGTNGVGGGSDGGPACHGLLGRSISANGLSLGTNPLILYRGGIKVGNSFGDDDSVLADSAAAAVQGVALGDRGPHTGLVLASRSLSATDRATRAQRERLKALLLERQMRKLGVRMSSRHSLVQPTSLPVLDEDDAEQRTSGRGPDHEKEPDTPS